LYNLAPAIHLYNVFGIIREKKSWEKHNQESFYSTEDAIRPLNGTSCPANIPERIGVLI